MGVTSSPVYLSFSDFFPLGPLFLLSFQFQKLQLFCAARVALLLIRLNDAGVLSTLFDSFAFQDHRFLPRVGNFFVVGYSGLIRI